MTAMGNVSAERSDLAGSRLDLGYQLTKNLLTIALQYLGDETKANVYFDQAILNAAFNESARKVERIINPGETQNVFDNVTQPDVRFVGINNGLVALHLGFKATATEPATPEDSQIDPGAEESGLAANAGWTTVRKYLNITNHGSEAGSYIIEKI